MKPLILMIHSYKGGSGKTIFAVNLANLLVNQYNKRVLLIEADFTMPSFQSIFTEHTPDIFFNDFLEKDDENLQPYIYDLIDERLGIVYCREDYNSNDFIHQTDQIWYWSKKEQVKQTLEKINYDYVIFDLSPGMSLFTINTFILANHIFLFMSADVQSLRGTKYLLNNVYSKIASVEDRDIHTIVNQYPDHPLMDKLLDQWTNDLKVKYQFLDTFFSIRYDTVTSFATANDNFILPKGDPTRDKFDEIIVDTIIGSDNV